MCGDPEVVKCDRCREGFYCSVQCRKDYKKMHSLEESREEENSSDEDRWNRYLTKREKNQIVMIEKMVERKQNDLSQYKSPKKNSKKKNSPTKRKSSLDNDRPKKRRKDSFNSDNDSPNGDANSLEIEANTFDNDNDTNDVLSIDINRPIDTVVQPTVNVEMKKNNDNREK